MSATAISPLPGCATQTIFDDAGLDVAVFHHHGVVEHRHIGHAAVAMTRIEIGAEYRVLLGRRHRRLHLGDDIHVAAGDPAHAARRLKLLGKHAHRYAAAAALARRPVSDRLAAAEAALGKYVVEFAGTLADEVGKDLPFFLPAKIWAWRRRGKIELGRIARVLSYGAFSPLSVTASLPAGGRKAR